MYQTLMLAAIIESFDPAILQRKCHTHFFVLGLESIVITMSKRSNDPASQSLSPRFNEFPSKATAFAAAEQQVFTSQWAECRAFWPSFSRKIIEKKLRVHPFQKGEIGNDFPTQHFD